MDAHVLWTTTAGANRLGFSLWFQTPNEWRLAISVRDAVPYLVDRPKQQTWFDVTDRFGAIAASDVVRVASKQLYGTILEMLGELLERKELAVRCQSTTCRSPNAHMRGWIVGDHRLSDGITSCFVCDVPHGGGLLVYDHVCATCAAEATTDSRALVTCSRCGTFMDVRRRILCRSEGSVIPYVPTNQHTRA